MNFALSDEQEFLKEAARGALSRVSTVEAAREALDGGALPDLWPTAVEAGWPGLLVSDAHGGAELGALEAMLVFEELGRVRGRRVEQRRGRGVERHVPEAAGDVVDGGRLDGGGLDVGRAAVIEHDDERVGAGRVRHPGDAAGDRPVRVRRCGRAGQAERRLRRPGRVEIGRRLGGHERGAGVARGERGDAVVAVEQSGRRQVA